MVIKPRINVMVYLKSETVAYSHDKAIAARTEGGVYCVYLDRNNVCKYPLSNITKITEQLERRYSEEPK